MRGRERAGHARRSASRAAARPTRRPRRRIQQQQTWVDLQIRQAMERGEFDDLPGAGKPIEGLGEHHDPDWWLKKLVERERIAVLPPSVALRKEDAELDDRLDKLNLEADVRREVEDFNERVIRARYPLPEGPPLITMPRDVDATVAAWRERREARRRRVRHAAAATPRPPAGRWWRRRDEAATGSTQDERGRSPVASDGRHEERRCGRLERGLMEPGHRRGRARGPGRRAWSRVQRGVPARKRSSSRRLEKSLRARRGQGQDRPRSAG